MTMKALSLSSCTQSEEEKPIVQTKYESEGEIIEVDCMPEDLQRILEEYPRAIIVKFYDQSGNE